jgi:hypothetical protein
LKLILTLQRETRGKPSSNVTVVGDKDLSALVLRWRKSSKQPKEKGVQFTVIRLINRGKLELILWRLHGPAELSGELHVEMGKVELTYVTYLPRVNDPETLLKRRKNASSGSPGL